MHPWLQEMQAVADAWAPAGPSAPHRPVFCNMEESPQLGVSHQYSSSLPTVIADVEWIAGWGYGSSGSCLHASPAFSSCRSGAPLPLPMVWPQQFSRGDCFCTCHLREPTVHNPLFNSKPFYSVFPNLCLVFEASPRFFCRLSLLPIQGRCIHLWPHT